MFGDTIYFRTLSPVVQEEMFILSVNCLFYRPGHYEIASSMTLFFYWWRTLVLWWCPGGAWYRTRSTIEQKTCTKKIWAVKGLSWNITKIPSISFRLVYQSWALPTIFLEDITWTIRKIKVPEQLKIEEFADPKYFLSTTSRDNGFSLPYLMNFTSGFSSKKLFNVGTEQLFDDNRRNWVNLLFKINIIIPLIV